MFDVIDEGSWKAMNKAVFMATGTWDTDATFWPDWKMHLLSYLRFMVWELT